MKDILCFFKIFICTLLVTINITSKAQLIYLGDDEIQKKLGQGYVLSTDTKRASGFVQLNYKYYFTTPNGNVYETDGTEGNTKIIKQSCLQNFPYLKATKKYVYFGESNSCEDVKYLKRYSPSTGVVLTTIPNENNRFVFTNGNVIPGKKNLVSEIYINYDRDALLIRHFAFDNFYVYKIDDDNDNPGADLVVSYPLDMKNVTTPIDIATTVETLNNEVYFNGRTKPTGEFETSIRIFMPTKADSRKYEYKIGFELLKQKVNPYFGFFRTPNNIYSLLKVTDSAGNYVHRLFYFNGKNISSVTGYFDQDATDYAIQKMGDEIYVSFKGNLWKFNESKSGFEKIIKEENPMSGWEEITKDKRFLNVGNYYLYRRGGKLSMYDAALKLTKEITTEALARNYNHFSQHNIYAYEGKNCFYFTEYINDKAVFIKYSPVNNSHTPIEFPQFKKQNFEEIKAIYSEGNKFIFLTSYIGKQDKLVFKMFIYTEEGLQLTKSATTVNPIVKNDTMPVPFFDDDVIDIKKYDKKRFSQQLTKIISNQGNQFEDIIGESIPSDFGNKKSSSVLLDGFKKGVIIDYKSTSYLYRYEAESFKIKGKANALAFLDLLDKEVQTLTAGNGIKRVVDMDMKVNKTLHYIYTGNVGYDPTEIKFLQLKAYCGADFVNPDDAIFTITVRIDKPARR